MVVTVEKKLVKSTRGLFAVQKFRTIVSKNKIGIEMCPETNSAGSVFLCYICVTRRERPKLPKVLGSKCFQ